MIDDPCRADGLKSMSQVFRTVTSSPSMLEDLNRDTIFEVTSSIRRLGVDSDADRVFKKLTGFLKFNMKTSFHLLALDHLFSDGVLVKIIRPRLFLSVSWDSDTSSI